MFKFLHGMHVCHVYHLTCLLTATCHWWMANCWTSESQNAIEISPQARNVRQERWRLFWKTSNGRGRRRTHSLPVQGAQCQPSLAPPTFAQTSSLPKCWLQACPSLVPRLTILVSEVLETPAAVVTCSFSVPKHGPHQLATICDNSLMLCPPKYFQLSHCK